MKYSERKDEDQSMMNHMAKSVGIETWYRVTTRNLYSRRQMVDSKSNILVTINSIILSVILGSFYMQLEESPHLIYAVAPMLITNVISIVLAVFATRPVIRKGLFTKEQVQNKSARLISFDDFYNVSEQDYEWAINEMMKDNDFLYGTMQRDIYNLGVGLSKRYRRILMAYNIFLIGLVVSIFMFMTCYILF